MAKTGIRVALIEDDDDLRESVTEWLELAGMHVYSARNAADFYRALPLDDFQVAVVDIGLPDQSGYVLAEYIRTNTHIAVIVLTARSTIDDKIKGYESGADLYLVKPVDCRELSAAIVSIAQRIRNPEMAGLPAGRHWTVSSAHWKISLASDTPVTLSVKELKFLTLLAGTPGQPVLRKTVLEELYQRHDYHAGRSLDSLVRRLRAKVTSVTGVDIPIRTVHAVGYSFVGSISVC